MAIRRSEELTRRTVEQRGTRSTDRSLKRRSSDRPGERCRQPEPGDQCRLDERLMLAIYAYGTNTGIRAVAAGGGHGHTEERGTMSPASSVRRPAGPHSVGPASHRGVHQKDLEWRSGAMSASQRPFLHSSRSGSAGRLGPSDLAPSLRINEPTRRTR